MGGSEREGEYSCQENYKGDQTERYTKENLFLRGERKKGRVRKPGERGAVHSDGAQEQSNFIRVDLDAEGGIQMYDVCDVRSWKKH